MVRSGGFRPCKSCGYQRSWAIRTTCYACGAALGSGAVEMRGAQQKGAQLGDWLTVAKRKPGQPKPRAGGGVAE
eukprot:2637868-Alexandrium_andersonii.AAC.1